MCRIRGFIEFPRGNLRLKPQVSSRKFYENVIYTQTNIDMLKQKTVWEIVTPELHPVVAKMIEAGVAAKCDSYEALAKHIGCPVAVSYTHLTLPTTSLV